MRLTQLALPGMRRQRWGKIVNLSSMGGKLTLPGGAFYHATKHAVEALSDALRFEVRGFGVDVIVIEPGPIKTSFGDTAVQSIDSPAAGDPAYAAFNAAARDEDQGSLRGPDGPLRRRPRGGRAGDREGHHRATPGRPATR